MSLKQTYIDSINADIAAANALKQEDFINDAKKKNEANKNKDINTYSTGMDSQIANTKNIYDKKISDADMEYVGEHERNAVQKLINERQIAEKNANLGITDSGLNRTQQTAAQLSYSNQKANIDLAHRNMLDNLNLALTDAVTALQNEKASEIRKIENSWDDLSYEQGANAYNNKLKYYSDRITSNNDALARIEEQEIKANNELIKQQQDLAYKLKLAEIEAAAKKPNVSYGAGGTSAGGYIVSSAKGTLSRDYSGSLKDNGVSTVYMYNADATIKTVTYTDVNSGISATFDGGVNPYTGKMNNDVTTKGKYDPSKAFSNGYQPNNIGGKKLVIEDKDAVIVKGKKQNVFKCGDKSDVKYYVWDGENSKYVEVVKTYFSSDEYRWDIKQK